jgi:signal transduction histidine kinase
MVSHRIMESHQGMIDIMSKVGKGTTNEVILLLTACSGEVTKSS